MAPVENRLIEFPIRKPRTRSAKSKLIEIEDKPKLQKPNTRSPLKQVKSPKPSPLKSVSCSLPSQSRPTTPYKVRLHFNENEENSNPNAKDEIVTKVLPKKLGKSHEKSESANLNSCSSSTPVTPLRNLNLLKSPVKTGTLSPRKALFTPTSDRILRSPLKKPLDIKSPVKTNSLSPRKTLFTPSNRTLRSPLKKPLDIKSPVKINPLSPRKSLFTPTSDRILRSPLKKSLDITSDNEDDENRNPTEQMPKRSPRKMVKIGEGSLFRADVSRLVEAKKALSTALPVESTGLVGRQKQLDMLKDFLRRNLGANEGKKSKGKRSIYISGPPGTGKTTCLKHLIKALPSDSEQITKGKEKTTMQPHCIFINCMALKNGNAIYEKIADNLLTFLGPIDSGDTNDSHKKALEDAITGKQLSSKILLVLDEIDQLDSKCNEVLYSLFEWPYLRNSKLVLVGIANSLDLTDRVLPRLKVRCFIISLSLYIILVVSPDLYIIDLYKLLIFSCEKIYVQSS